jgi:hypothetical protein
MPKRQFMNNPHADLALTLSLEFQKFLVQHPETARQIPKDAVIVFQLDRNAAFNRWAKALAEKYVRSGKKVVKLRVRALAPPVSRIKAVELVS